MTLAGLSPVATLAQNSSTSRVNLTCWQPGPLPECRRFVLSEVGGYVGYVRIGDRRFSHLAATVNWGAMFNRGAHNAYGATLSLWLPDNVNAGASLRYRRWFEGGSSLDLAFGTVVWGDHVELARSLGLLG